MEIIKKHKCFEGETIFCEHESNATKSKMKFSAFLPKDIGEINSAIIWLSGLTCNEENFITKAGAQKYLANTNTMIICPDTSPRGLGIEGEDEFYYFGTGAGFYVNATNMPYAKNYNMYDYIMQDIVKLLKDEFKVTNLSISGHSMGGHGALMMALNEDVFKCVSAFAPVLNPSNSSAGRNAFLGYLGRNEDDWKKYDTTRLYENGTKFKTKVLIEQGSEDEFYEGLGFDNFTNICEGDESIQVNTRVGYDHGYYFISTFIEDHIKFHIKALNNL